MSLLREVEWESCLLEARPDPELAARLRKRHKRVPPTIEYFSPCPDLFESIVGLNALLLTHIELDRFLLDLIGIVVSQDNSCRYCYAMQRAMMIAMGVKEEKLRELSQEVLTGDLSAGRRAALEFARRMSRSNPLPGADDVAKLRQAGFTNRQVRELAGAISLHVFFNRIATVFALPPQPMEELPQRWYARLMRPFFNLYIEYIHSKVSPVALPAGRAQGPFASVVQAMDGFPMAIELRNLLDTLLTDGALPARSKALIFAVVGRALECPGSIDEGRRIAVAAGVHEAAVSEALDHLVSDRLSDTENLLLPLARETVWYQPASIQRRARRLRESLSTEEFIEGVLAACAANMVCRLGAVVVDH